MDQRQTNWQVIQLTQASLTEDGMPDDGRGRTDGQPEARVCHARPFVGIMAERGTVLLIRQIEVNCGLRGNEALSSLVWLRIYPK